MLGARLLAYVTGTVNQELLLRNEYLMAENRILRGQIEGRLLLSEGEKGTLAEIAHRLPRKSLRLCLARLRVRWFDPIAEPAELADHSCRAPLFRLFGDGWAPFVVADAPMQDQPDQGRHCRWAMAPMAWLCPRRGTERRYTISKMLPLVLAAALAA